jgi:hypothetical protein
MNSPLVIEQARALAGRPEIATAGSSDARIIALYHRVFARRPEALELQAAREFLALGPTSPMPAHDRSELNPTQQLAQVLLMTNELMFVD